MKHSTSDGTVYQRNGFGPTVVLIHGLGMNRTMWQWQLPSLTNDFDVLTYDLWGHGESSNPPSRPSLRLFSNQLIGLLNEANVTTTGVVGFSVGGMIARRFAYDHPSRLSALAILISAHDRTPRETEAVQTRADQSRERGAYRQPLAAATCGTRTILAHHHAEQQHRRQAHRDGIAQLMCSV